MPTRDRSRPPLHAREARPYPAHVYFAGGLLLVALALAAPAAEPPQRLTFAELAACPLVPDAAAVASGAALSAPIRAANGARVRVAGYMLPLAVEQGLARQFLLLRNQNACCFGQMPAANEYVVVETSGAGLPVRMDTPVALVGRLRVAPVLSGGAVVQFYNLDDPTLAEAAP